MKIKKWSGSAWVQEYPEVDVNNIVATGTPSSSTFLRGDGQWISVDSGNQFVNISGDTMTGNLTIDSASFASLTLDRESTTSSSIVQFTNNGGVVGGIGGFGNDGLQFRTTDGTQMVIDASNNVGIGTTSPLSKLNVHGDSGLYISTVTNNPTDGAQIRFSDNSSQAQYGFIKYKHANQTVETEPVNSDDGFIIGGSEANTVVSIQGSLNVENQSNFEQQVELDGTDLHLNGVGTNTAPGNNAMKVSGYGMLANRGAVYFTNTNSAGDISFHIGGVHGSGDNLMRLVGSTSRVGIGTALPSDKLEVNGNVRANRFTDRTNTSYYLDPASTSILYNIDIQNATTFRNDATLDHDGTGTTADSHGIVFTARAASTDFTRELLMDSSGNLDFNGNALATENYVDTEIASLVASAPSTLDTLNELAAALGDDANFSTTVTNSLAGKLNLTGGTLTGTLTTRAINASNFNITGVNMLEFNDPGPNEGIQWNGGNFRIYESPDDLTTNSAGNLQFVTGGVRRMTIGNDGYLYVSNTVQTPQLQMTSNPSRTKLRVWSGGTYGMGMTSGFTYGGLGASGGEYAMTFQMNDDTDRGFWWGHSVHTTAQGAMALTTDGELTVANAIRVGYGEADTTTPADNVLDINGNVTIAKVSSGGQNQIKFQEVGTTKTQITSNYGDNKFYLYHEGDNRLVIDSGGNIGIGTSSPDEKLHIEGNILVDAYNNSPGDSGIFFREGYTASQPSGAEQPYNVSITLYDGSNAGASYDGLAINGFDGVAVRTNNDSTPKMVVKQNGNVGIGTTTPDEKLTVSGKIKANDNFEHTGTGGYYLLTSSDGFRGAFYDNGSVTSIYGDGDGTTPVININSGLVGIGTTSPGYNLDVVGNIRAKTGSSTKIWAENTTTGQSSLELKNSNTHLRLIGQLGGFQLYDQLDAASRFEIDTNGNSKIFGNLTIQSTFPRIYLTDTDHNSDYSILNSNGSYIIYDDTNGANRFRINSSGNAVIGDANPSNIGFLEKSLEIQAGSSSDTTLKQAGLVISGSSDADDADDFAYVSFRNNHSSMSNDRVAEIRVMKNGTNVNTADMHFYTSNGSSLGARMTILNSGNIGVGTTTPGYDLDVAGDVNVTGDFRVNGTAISTGGGGNTWTEIKTGSTTLSSGTTATNVSLGSNTVDDTTVIAFELCTGVTTSYTSQIFIVKLEDSNNEAAGILYNAGANSTSIRTGSLRVYRTLSMGPTSTSITFVNVFYHTNGSSSETADTVYVGKIWKLGVTGA